MSVDGKLIGLFLDISRCYRYALGCHTTLVNTDEDTGSVRCKRTVSCKWVRLFLPSQTKISLRMFPSGVHVIPIGTLEDGICAVRI